MASPGASANMVVGRHPTSDVDLTTMTTVDTASDTPTVYMYTGVCTSPTRISSDSLSRPSIHTRHTNIETNSVVAAVGGRTTSRHSRHYGKKRPESGTDRNSMNWSGYSSGCKSTPLSLRSMGSCESKTGDIRNWYDLEMPPLREGSFGKIFKARDLESSEFKAVKSIPYVQIEEDRECFEFELNISRQLKHPNIIQLFETIRDDVGESWHLVMDLCTGGDMFDLIKNNCGPGRIREPVMARFVHQMLDGIKYCHHYSFCHRDIKPENYMLAEPGKASQLKLIDFGLATTFEPGTPMTLRCGTLHYTAPEVFRCKYNEKCDVWGIGIVFYMLCMGQWPFFDKNEDRLAKLIASGPDVFGRENTEATASFRLIPGDVIAMMDLLKALLNPDAAKRPSAKELLASNAWIEKARNLPVDPSCCCTVL